MRWEDDEEREPYWTVDELQALPIPRLEAINVDDNGTKFAIPSEYVAHFQPIRLTKNNTVACCGCGANLTGLLLGTFTWGMAHGEGFCGRCRYPTRMYHFVGERRFAFPLQYHPDELIKPKER